MKTHKKINMTEIVNLYRSVIILIIIALVAAIASPAFLSVGNIFNVIRQIAMAGIVACGMTFVILLGGIDLSVGSVVGLAGVIAAGILRDTDNVLFAISGAVAVGVICGALNGLFVSRFSIPPFIATLGMMTLLRGCILVYTNGSPIPIKNDVYKFIGKGDVLGGIPVPILLLFVIYAIAHFVLSNTRFGRYVYALGGGREASRLSGINVKRVEWIVYIISGFLSAITGIILTARLGSAQSTNGEGIEMDAIAAVILGGTSMSGGTGYVLPTVIGAMIMGIIDNILTLMNVNPHATKIVKGVVILAAVLIDKKIKDVSAKRVMKEEVSVSE
ncbi:MAG: ribose ABC transporter permease [Eubacteriales bacterium]|nr:ribose ABC transporter permease [Eubacteriales bacterium]